MTAAYILATYGGTRRELGAALVFTTVNLLGTFIFLLSVAGLYHVTGTLNMGQIAERAAAVDENAAILIAVGFFAAFSVKLGLFPFHFWLPTVYTGARPAVAAILSGGLANIGAYGLLRFGGELLPGELALAGTALIVIGCASVDLRRRAGRLAPDVERDAGLLRDRPGRVRARGHRRGRPGRLRGGDPLLGRQRAQQDAAVPHRRAARRDRRRRVRARRAQRGGRPTGRRVHRQARAVPRRGGRSGRARRCSSSAARSRSSTCSRSTSSTSGAGSGRARRVRGRSRRWSPWSRSWCSRSACGPSRCWRSATTPPRRSRGCTG